jgi:outer membrane protein OmpA-like peptidoglycan-associated protein
MKGNVIRIAVAGGLLLCGGMPGKAQQQDVEGSRDHPLISRYPGSYIRHYILKEFDEFELPMGKVADGKLSKSQHLEGKITYLWYEAPKDRSQLEIFRNFEAALKQAGFVTLFTCARDQCGADEGITPYPNLQQEMWGAGYQTRYLSAKLSRPGTDMYVSLDVQTGGCGDCEPWVYLYVVEAKPMEAGLVKVDAASLAGDISRTGHASVYGITFDTGKADVKPESDGTLKEIAKLLQQDPKLQLYVVGHTDNQGTLEMNMDLSMRRANAVVQVLSSKYGVAAARLKPLGDGPSAPVAPNDAEEGRAKNRRVELVKQ